ncbi:hypothetical protein NFJ02_45g113330 [Pycnococcus provasolii]
MRTIGCTIYIWTPKELRTAADSRAKAFTYLGWKNASTCFVLDPANGHVYQRGHQLRSIELVDSANRVLSVDSAPRHQLDSQPVEGGETDAQNKANDDTATPGGAHHSTAEPDNTNPPDALEDSDVSYHSKNTSLTS